MIRTQRLWLRRAEPGDLMALHAIFTDPRAMRYWARPAHDNLDQSRAYLDRMMNPQPGTADDYVIELKGKVIGKAGAWRLPEVGFILHPDHWGKGYAHEALWAVIQHLFATHPIDPIVAEADPRNAASLGLLSRLGFIETHRAEKTLLWGDEWCDSVYLALTRNAWARVQNPQISR